MNWTFSLRVFNLLDYFNFPEKIDPHQLKHRILTHHVEKSDLKYELKKNTENEM